MDKWGGAAAGREAGGAAVLTCDGTEHRRQSTGTKAAVAYSFIAGGEEHCGVHIYLQKVA